MMALCSFLRRLRRDGRGASAAEFALVLPLALLILLGLIDVGRYVWTINQLEKAAQYGARYAVATRLVPSGLDDYEWVGRDVCGTTLKAGDRICKEALGTIDCTSGGCQCAKAPCPAIGTPDTVAFGNIADRMRVIMPELDDDLITVSYSGSGLGYAGDPALGEDGEPLSDVAPIVTVSIARIEFRFISLLGLEISDALPLVSASLTLEDGDGDRAY